MAASDRERQAPVNDSEVLRLLAGPPSVPVEELAGNRGFGRCSGVRT
jgi:hypothetical protein